MSGGFCKGIFRCQTLLPTLLDVLDLRQRLTVVLWLAQQQDGRQRVHGSERLRCPIGEDESSNNNANTTALVTPNKKIKMQGSTNRKSWTQLGEDEQKDPWIQGVLSAKNAALKKEARKVGERTFVAMTLACKTSLSLAATSSCLCKWPAWSHQHQDLI